MFRCLWLIALLYTGDAFAQSWGHISGEVRDADTGETLPRVNVVVYGTNFGTATREDGRYSLQLPVGRYTFLFSFVGFTSHADSVVIAARTPVTLNIMLKPGVLEGEELVVEDVPTLEAGVQQLSPEQVRNMPSPFKGYQALLALPGVSASNELSNQYSVRGGGFNENLIFLNGFEIHMPFRPRQGEQEGLGLFNPELSRRITLYTGGFPARYGGKISSALDIEYAGSTALHGAASLSLLDGGVAASATHGPLAWQFGARKARARRFFATQELKGNYQPDYEDVQGRLAYTFGRGHELEFLGLWADHSFQLDPRGRRTFFGTVSSDGGPVNLRSVWIAYSDESHEKDGYQTGFGGVRLGLALLRGLRAEHDVSIYSTRETEAYRLEGQAIIYDVVPDEDADLLLIPRGMALQTDYANNEISVTTLTGKGRYSWTSMHHTTELGWSVRQLLFTDNLEEQSLVEGRSTQGDLVRVVVDSLRGDVTLNESQLSVHAEDAFSVGSSANRLTVTASARADFYSFNDEWTVSPRLNVRFEASPVLTLTAAAGVYYQQPTYRELRGTPSAASTLNSTLNRDIRTQRVVLGVLGAELFLPRRRLYLRAEGYWKRLDRIISYSLENVRVNYSGINDARGHAYGLDLQARGEFVPGMESWINYSFLVARERFLPEYVSPLTSGLLPRPADQRHTVALFVQDYVPTDPTWKLHLRALFGSGLPYTPPHPGKRVGSVVVQIPGERHSARYPEFRRVDFGVTKIIELTQHKHPINLEITSELLNVFDIVNTVAYSWVPDATGIWQRIPTRLTPRTLNVRLRVSF